MWQLLKRLNDSISPACKFLFALTLSDWSAFFKTSTACSCDEMSSMVFGRLHKKVFSLLLLLLHLTCFHYYFSTHGCLFFCNSLFSLLTILVAADRGAKKLIVLSFKEKGALCSFFFFLDRDFFQKRSPYYDFVTVSIRSVCSKLFFWVPRILFIDSTIRMCIHTD